MDISLEESTTEKVPLLLHEIVQRILAESQTPDSLQKDLLFMLIVILMVENGFLPLNNELELIDLMKSFNMQQLSKWKLSTGIFDTTFILYGFRNTTVKLLMSPLGATVLVNLIINELNFETYSMCLPVSRYVVAPQATSVPMIFRDLKHFSTLFKNKILAAVKSRVLSYHGYPSASLIGLPIEVFHNIILNLSIVDIVAMSEVCNSIKVLIEDQSLWHALCKRDFGDTLQNADQNNWKEHYVKNYVNQQDNRIRNSYRRAGSMHDYMDYADYVSYVDNPMWNII